MTVYVLDASVAAKWYLPEIDEPYTKEAVEVFADFTSEAIGIAVPDLFFSELGNIFWKAVRRGRLSRDVAEASLANAAELRITAVPSRGILHRAFAIATEFDRSVYDSVYVALAAASDATLLTADQRLANALTPHFPVQWLGAYTPAR